MKWLLTIFLLPIQLIWGDIHQTVDWAPVERSIKEATDGTWVLFDVDDVLIVSEELVLHPAHDEVFHKYKKQLAENLEPEALMELWGVFFSSVQPRLIDPKVLEVLALVEEKELRAFALTHCGTGKVGCIESLEDWRIQHLKNLGIHFDQLCDYEDEWVFEKLSWKKGVPLLKKGVIFASYRDKGEVFSATLDIIGNEPKHVIFIDDKLENLKSVEAACQKRGIQFLGFEYIAVANETPMPLNLEWVEAQFHILENEKKWISHKEIEHYLEESK